MSADDSTVRLAAPSSPVLLEEGTAGALLARLVQARAALDADRATARQRLAKLLASPTDKQRDELLSDPRLQTSGVCELLLELSEAALEIDGREAERLGELALIVAERLDRGAQPAPLVDDLSAQAWASIGEARRGQGRLLEAEFALRGAAGALAHGSGDLLVEARLLEFEAALRRSQGRGGEAAALLKQAASRFVELHAFHQLSRVLAERERVLSEAPQPPAAGTLTFRPDANDGRSR
jgi:hypothetical protein